VLQQEQEEEQQQQKSELKFFGSEERLGAK
jgi:hypothetical protein